MDQRLAEVLRLLPDPLGRPADSTERLVYAIRGFAVSIVGGTSADDAIGIAAGASDPTALPLADKAPLKLQARVRRLALPRPSRGVG